MYSILYRVFTGKLRRDKTAVDAFEAMFPAGTLSGAPKIRAMEIIDELENIPRGTIRRCSRILLFKRECRFCNNHKDHGMSGKPCQNTGRCRNST